MSHKEAPPETPTQIAVREWHTVRLAPRGVTVGWGRDKRGRFLAEYARDAEAAWIAAQQHQKTRDLAGYEDCSDEEVLEIIQHLDAKVNCFRGALEFYAKGNALNMMDDVGFKARQALLKFDL